MDVARSWKIHTAGGRDLCEMGAHFDVACFYHAALQIVSDENDSRVVDRVYKRYLHENDYDAGASAFSRIVDHFQLKGLKGIEWTHVKAEIPMVVLKKFEVERNDNEGSVINRYTAFARTVARAIQCADWVAKNADRTLWDDFSKSYVRTVRDAFFSTDGNRTFAELDALGPDDPPFWLNDKNYPNNALSWGELMAMGLLRDSWHYSDAIVKQWISKNTIPTAATKRIAATDTANNLSATQRQMLLDAADEQERKQLKVSKKH
jgi:hypothetical protein